MIEYIKSLELGKWTILFIGAYLIWRFILKSAFEIWLKNNLAYKSTQHIESLKSQREIHLKQLEFGRVKMERTLPALEKINDILYSYRMMSNTYLYSILNKIALPSNFESDRLKYDEVIAENISKVAIYVPIEFRSVLYCLRKIMSNSWCDPIIINTVTRECADLMLVSDKTIEILKNLNECFFEMSKETLSMSNETVDFKLIVSKYGFDELITPLDKSPLTQYVWKFILLHENFSSDDLIDIQNKCKAVYHQ